MAADCNPLDAACVTGAAVNTAVDSVLGEAAKQVATAAGDLFTSMFAWWTQTPSFDLAQSPAAELQGLVRPIAVYVAIGAVMIQGIRMMFIRRADPLADIAGGLFVLAASGATGLALMQLFLSAGDAFSKWVLQWAARRANGALGDRLIDLIGLGGPTGLGAALLLLVGLLGFVIGLVQWILLLVRDAGLILLSSVLPVAAAGYIGRSTRNWLRRVVSWSVALAAYKPIAALIYAAGFATIGNTKTPSGTFAPMNLAVGLVMLGLALFALPALVKVFEWAYDGVDARLVGGSGRGAALTSLAIQAYSTSSRGERANAHADYVSSQVRGSGPPPAAPPAAGTGGAAAAPTAGASAAAAGPITLAAAGAHAAYHTAKSSAQQLRPPTREAS